MLIQQRFTVAAPLEVVWAYFRDIPAVAACLPGAGPVNAVDERTYQGSMRVRVGPLGFQLAGRLVEEEIDEAARRATLRVAAEDRRLASAVNATLRLTLAESAGQTEVSLETDANVLGRLGQFGQGVIKLTADSVLKQFASCVQQRLTSAEQSASGGQQPEA